MGVFHFVSSVVELYDVQDPALQSLGLEEIFGC